MIGAKPTSIERQVNDFYITRAKLLPDVEAV